MASIAIALPGEPVIAELAAAIAKAKRPLILAGPEAVRASQAGAVLALARSGGIPVFADIALDDFTLDPASVEAASTDKTVAIMPVHLYGHPAKMDQLRAIAGQAAIKNLPSVTTPDRFAGGTK